MKRYSPMIVAAALVALPAQARSASDEELREAIRERAEDLFDELNEMEGRPESQVGPAAAPEIAPAPTEPPPPSAAHPQPSTTTVSPTAHPRRGGGVSGVIRGVAGAFAGGVRSIGSGIVGLFGGGPPAIVRVEVEVETDEEQAEALRDIHAFVHLARRKAHEHRHHRQMIRDLARAKAQRDAALVIVETAEPAHPQDETVDLARDRSFRIGFEGHGAPGPGNSWHNPSFAGFYGGDLALNVAPFLALGVGQIGATRGDDQWTINAAPYAELFFFIGDWLQLYAQGGVATQLQVAGGEPDAFGAAAYGGLGGRFWIGSHFSVGPAVRTFVVVSEQFAVTDHLLPREAIIITGGVDCHLHF